MYATITGYGHTAGDRTRLEPLTLDSKKVRAFFETQKVSVYYGSFRAVTDVSLTIHENEITAFIGPSGCGKTTVLRTLNRLNDLIPEARVEGEVHYRGANLYGSGVSPIAVRRPVAVATLTLGIDGLGATGRGDHVGHPVAGDVRRVGPLEHEHPQLGVAVEEIPRHAAEGR